MEEKRETRTSYDFGALSSHWRAVPVAVGMTYIHMTFSRPFSKIPKTSFAYCSLVHSVLPAYVLELEWIRCYHFQANEKFPNWLLVQL